MDYFSWLNRHIKGREASEDESHEAEQLVTPSEPIEVQEFNGASTTVIQRIRSAIAKRFRERSDP